MKWVIVFLYTVVIGEFLIVTGCSDDPASYKIYSYEEMYPKPDISYDIFDSTYTVFEVDSLYTTLPKNLWHLYPKGIETWMLINAQHLNPHGTPIEIWLASPLNYWTPFTLALKNYKSGELLSGKVYLEPLGWFTILPNHVNVERFYLDVKELVSPHFDELGFRILYISHNSLFGLCYPSSPFIDAGGFYFLAKRVK